MWNSPMPEQADGWAGALTFPRELTMKDGQLRMTPVQEIEQLREKALLLMPAPKQIQTNLVLPVKHVEYLANFSSTDDVIIMINDAAKKSLIRLSYQAATGVVTLEKYNDDQPRTVILHTAANFDVHLLLDNSSAELFINAGEACFTERIYTEKSLQINTQSQTTNYDIKVYQLGRGTHVTGKY